MTCFEVFSTLLQSTRLIASEGKKKNIQLVLEIYVYENFTAALRDL
jgi:hypothetical protein